MTLLNDINHDTSRATRAGCVGCPNYIPNQCCHEPSSPEFDKEFDEMMVRNKRVKSNGERRLGVKS